MVRNVGIFGFFEVLPFPLFDPIKMLYFSILPLHDISYSHLLFFLSSSFSFMVRKNIVGAPPVHKLIIELVGGFGAIAIIV